MPQGSIPLATGDAGSTLHPGLNGFLSSFLDSYLCEGLEQVPCLALTIAVILSDHRRPHTTHGDLAALAGMPGTAAWLMPLPRRHYWPCDLALHVNWRMDTAPPDSKQRTALVS